MRVSPRNTKAQLIGEQVNEAVDAYGLLCSPQSIRK